MNLKFSDSIISKVSLFRHLPALLLVLISYFTLFQGYDQPDKLFWDENYHIAAAQKYINGIFFMEPHPPLGKLLIALGEVLLDANENDSCFTDLDYGKQLPENFSFAGYRFFPTLLASLCPLLLYLLLRMFTTVPLAFLISILLAFENSFIVHSRSAMLESIQIFFILLFLLMLSKSYKIFLQNKDRQTDCLILLFGSGLALGAALATKINAVVLLIPLFIAVLFFFRTKRTMTASLSGFSGIAVSFCLIWLIHIQICTEVNNKLPNQGYYQASEDYRLELASSESDIFSFFPKLYDHLMFLPHYTKGVPDLNFCKDTENGSPWYWWPLGGKAVRYRYDRSGEYTRYLYLAVNPFGWGLSLLGIILGFSVFFSWLFFEKALPKEKICLTTIFLFCWSAYILMVGSSGRVMYLYHYFIPLLFGWILLALLIPEITQIAGYKVREYQKFCCLIVCVTLELFFFNYFSPLTYAKPLTDKQISKKNFLSVWDIACTSCKSSNPVARPLGDSRRKLSPGIFISGLKAVESFQEWGDPQMNITVIQKPLIVNKKTYSSGIGVHANSRLQFINDNQFSTFRATTGVPDYLLPSRIGSVIFHVVADGRTLWSSDVLHPGDLPQSVEVSITGRKYISLEVNSADNGNTEDHALWLSPEFLK